VRQRPVGNLLGFQLSQVARKLQKTYEAAFAPFGLTPSQALILDQLWQEDGLPLKEVGARAHLDPTSVNWLVGQLEKAGLAERQKDAADRRLVRLWLTQAGRSLQGEVYGEAQRQEQALEAVLLRYLTTAELGALSRGMQVLVDELPEGDDLLATVIAVWQDRMARLRLLVEGTQKNEGGSPR
jgi:DNA-binding MarR family transcriptional regulator